MLGLRHYRGVAVDLIQDDLTAFDCDAMVNAANERLADEGGLGGAIHRAGGPEILAACRLLGGAATGTAVVTTAGALPARWVVHAAQPVWQGGDHGEAALLASAYQASLQLAAGLGARHVAFPALSTGAYGYPPAPAADVALTAVRDYIDLAASSPPGAVKRVTFVLDSLEHYHLFQDSLFRLYPEDET